MKSQGAKLSFSSVSVRWGTFGPTFFSFMGVWGGLSPCRREQKPSFFPARENRSPALGLHPEKPRACAAQMQIQTRCATCSPQARGEEADRANRFAGSRRITGSNAGDEPAVADSPAPERRVRELLGAAAQPRGCAGGGKGSIIRVRQTMKQKAPAEGRA